MAPNTRPIAFHDLLPGIFRADEVGGVSFLSTFLLAFERVFEQLEAALEGTPGGTRQLMVRSVAGTTVNIAAFESGPVEFPAGTTITFTPQPALAASWPLDEGQGQLARDVSGQGLHGTFGAPPHAPQWIHELSGAALHFDGDAFVDVERSIFLEPATVTVEAWVRGTGSDSSTYILAKGADDCVAASYALYTGASSGLCFYIFDGANYILSPDGGTAIWDGNWHHAAGSYDGQTVRLYVDGVEIQSGTPATLTIKYELPDDTRLHIGAYRGTCERMFTGDIGAVRVWTRALTRAEVEQRAQGQELCLSDTGWRATLAQAIPAHGTRLTQIEVEDAGTVSALGAGTILNLHPGGIPDLFSPDTTPPPQFAYREAGKEFAFLSDLTSWIALPLRTDLVQYQSTSPADYDVGTTKWNRIFFRAALPLLAQRGTLPGLDALLRAWLKGDLLEATPRLIVLTDLTPARNDVDAILQLDQAATLDVDTVLGAGPPFFFIADIIADPAVPALRTPIGLDAMQRAARALLDAEKPGHTYYQLRVRASTMQLAAEGEHPDPSKSYAQIGDTTLLWDAPWTFDSDR